MIHQSMVRGRLWPEILVPTAEGQPWVGPPPFLGVSLAGIACAKDLVGGTEDSLGGPLGECLAVAP